MKRYGFSLIEFLIYCTLLMFMSFLVLQFFYIHSRGLFAIAQKNQSAISLYNCFDILNRDIQSAYSQPEYWHYSSDEIVFKTNNECIGWVLKNKNVYRIKGDYNFLSGHWNTKSKTLLFKHAKKFEITLIKGEQRIIQVKALIETNQGSTLYKTIALINKVVS
jgi:hypothetical protein